MELVKEELADKGYAVLKNFLTSTEAEAYKEQFSELMTMLGNDAVLLHGGMVQYVGHSKPQWELRRKAAGLFGELWNCTELLTSFDGFCYMDGNRRVKRVPYDSFLHRDQNLSEHALKTYQGLVNLGENLTQESGGFVCVPGSHRIDDYGKIFEPRAHKDQWYLFTDEEKVALAGAGYRPEFVPLGRGDFLFWDTRVLHCNTKCYEKGSFRVAAYICMVPRPLGEISPKFTKILLAREKAAAEKRCARHYPLENFKCFPATPRFSSRGFASKLARVLDTYDLTSADKMLI